jgi:hypothetical protein
MLANDVMQSVAGLFPTLLANYKVSFFLLLPLFILIHDQMEINTSTTNMAYDDR